MSPPPQSNNLPPGSPEYLDKLSVDQRSKLLEFVVRADAIIGDGDFDRNEWTDAELMALSLRSAQVLGYEGRRLESLFEREFGIAGVTEGQLGDWLAVLLLEDAERKILVAAGGRN
jgi:hypothetical protein